VTPFRWGKPIHNRGGHTCPRECRETHPGLPQAEREDRNRPERRSRRNTRHIRFRHRVPEETLHQRPRDSEAGAGGQAQERPGKTQFPKNQAETVRIR